MVPRHFFRTLDEPPIHRPATSLGITYDYGLHTDSRKLYSARRRPGRVMMERRVKEFVDIGDQVSLDALIEQLTQLRETLPDESDAELRLRGDEIFGHRITITYFRGQTEDEAECERRYAEAAREAK